MRLTEIIDFLNSKTTPNKEEYSHLEIREEVEDAEEDEFGNKPMRLIKKYREIKKDYRKGLK